mgnify:CR=1 FL=1
MNVFKKITIILLFLSSTALPGQNITGYSYWLNDASTQAGYHTLTPSNSAVIQDSLNISMLNIGLNVFHIRVFDSNGLSSSIMNHYFIILPDSAISQSKISKLEYWIDDNFDGLTAGSVLNKTMIWLDDSVSIAHLNPGLHTFRMRFRDTRERYSSTLCRYFFIPEDTTSINNSLLAVEHWLDNDFGGRVNQAINSQTDLLMLDSLNLSILPEGLHTFNARFQDSKHQWSSNLTQYFLIFPDTATTNRQVTKVEYWIDKDKGNAVTMNLSPTQEYIIIDSLDLSNYSNGLHVISHRFLDNNGQWSSTAHSYIIKQPEVTSTTNALTRWRYWFDNDIQNAQVTELTSLPSSVLLNDSIDFTGIWKGEHILNLQFLDHTGRWSSVIRDTIFKNALPIASFTHAKSNYCDSTLVCFDNFSIDADTYLWNFGDGTSSTDSAVSHTYYNPGIYNVSLTVTDTSLQKDSTIVQPIVIVGNSFANLTVTVCDSFISPGGNHVWYNSGIYQDTIPKVSGCDSIFTINLSINQSYQLDTFVTACDQYNWNGSTHTSSGLYQLSDTTVLGCDSLVNLHLTINQSTSGDTAAYACDHFIWYGNTYTSSGIYTETLTNVAGCDSTVSLDLTINQSTYANLYDTACFSYISPSGKVLTSSGVYADTLLNTVGCDSVLTINLTIHTVDTAVTVNGVTLVSLATNGSWQWLDCDNNFAEIPGAVDAVFNAVANGSYAVKVIQNNCVDTSNCYLITDVGINNPANKEKIMLFPNPAHEFIQLAGIRQPLDLYITDYTGRILLRINDYNGGKINLKGMNKGLYILKTESSDVILFILD